MIARSPTASSVSKNSNIMCGESAVHTPPASRTHRRRLPTCSFISVG